MTACYKLDGPPPADFIGRGPMNPGRPARPVAEIRCAQEVVMALPDVVTREQWVAARTKLLAAEKEAPCAAGTGPAGAEMFAHFGLPAELPLTGVRT